MSFMRALDRELFNAPYAGIGADQPQVLRDLFGIRFHHFHDVDGRLVATIATEPVPDVRTSSAFLDFEEPMVLVAAAIVFRGTDPLSDALTALEAELRSPNPQRDFVRHLADAAFAKASMRREPDAPTRARGRAIALGRLRDDDTNILMSASMLKEQIRNRTILENFHGGRRLGRNRLRPRQPFKGSRGSK